MQVVVVAVVEEARKSYKQSRPTGRFINNYEASLKVFLKHQGEIGQF